MKTKAEEILHINYRVPKGASGAYVDYAKEFMKRELGKNLVEFLLQGKQGIKWEIELEQGYFPGIPDDPFSLDEYTMEVHIKEK